MKETLIFSDGRDILHVERFLPHRIEKVWRSLTEPGLLKGWFPSQVDIDLRIGGVVRFFGDPNMPADSRGTIVELDPPQLIAYDWGGDLLRWQLSAVGDGTLLVLDQTVADHAGAASFAAGWNSCIDSLALRLADEPVDPEVMFAAWPELHEKFIATLGLGHGTLSQDGDRWSVHLERQLTVPIGRAAELLRGSALEGAEMRDGNGGARLVATRADLATRDEAAALLNRWEAAAREIGSRAVDLASAGAQSPST